MIIAPEESETTVCLIEYASECVCVCVCINRSKGPALPFHLSLFLLLLDHLDLAVLSLSVAVAYGARVLQNTFHLYLISPLAVPYQSDRRCVRVCTYVLSERL